AFTSAYAYRVTGEHLRLSAALSATEQALSREERLTALDGLAAAAAHELGTPLATIQVTAREMERELPAGDLKEDAGLLVSQTQRCQKILKRLSQSSEVGDAVHNVISLDVLLREAAKPFEEVPGCTIDFRFDAESTPVPDRLQRRPEVIYGLRNLVENACKYASEKVEISAGWTDEWITVTITDDGPGIPQETMVRLGEPYPRSFSQPSDNKGGLGLGFFIAKTLLERTGARLTFGNRSQGTGAWVRAKWPLVKLLERTKSLEETPPAKAFAL
ncbi:MAG: ATP-binding protein, partial [Pseudomonadota bacterium]